MNNAKYNIDFVSKRKIFFTIPIVILTLAVIVSFFGMDFSIDFKGGTIITYSYDGELDMDAAKSQIEDVVQTGVTIQQGDSLQSGSKSLSISFTSNEGLTVEKQSDLTDALQLAYPDNNLQILDSNDVSPTSGRNFLLKCLVAMIFAIAILVLYIAWRFKKIGGWTAGICAIIALLHDAFFVYAAFAFFRFEINSNFVAVVLTILGYSVNDTIVIYDRIRENKKLMPKASLPELVNLSLNQSLTRSLRTSITTIMAMVVVTIVAFAYGIDSILSFSLPLIVGMVAGAYSSLCIATQIWVIWNEKKEKKLAKAK